MSLEPTAVHDIIYIACVVESSLSLASEWHRILAEYISPLLKRLGDLNSGYRFRMAFVTYATADARPSPLLAKRFFADLQPISKELREEPSKLGIGQTASGGNRGMAALEGLVAALELFDTLRGHCPPKDSARSNICHIFHVAVSPPDAAEHPQWNDSPQLDFVTWETLPSELRKRNINLSSIYLCQLPRFSELQSSSATGAVVQPWFTTKPTHTILLAGFPSPTSQKAVSKRPGEPHNAERTPESKRLRISHPSMESASPNITTVNAPCTQPQLPVALPAQIQAPPPAVQSNPLQPQPQVPPPPAARMAIYERIRSAEAHLRNLESAIKTATAAGDQQKTEILKKEWMKHAVTHQKFKQAIAAYMQTQQNQQVTAKQQVQAQGQIQTMGQGQSGQNQGHGQVQAKEAPISQGSAIMPSQVQTSPVLVHKETVPPIIGDGNNGTDNANDSKTFPGQNPGQGPDPQALGQPLQSRSIGGSGFPQIPNTNPKQMSPDVAAQMQKLVEQQQRNRPQHLGGVGGVMGQNQNQNTTQQVDMASGSGTGTSGQPQLGGGQGPGSEQHVGGGGVTKPTPSAVWQGVLSWSGFDAATQGRKEVRAHVVASTQNLSESRRDTWPKVLTLSPTRESAVSMPDLQLWMKRHKPVLCTFQAQQRIADPKINESHYRSLVQLLTTRNIYAVAGWTLPSGEQKSNALVFPVNGMGLVGAFFPLTGIPEMPKSSAAVPVGANMGGGGGMNVGGLSLPPTVVAQLSRLTQDQRSGVLAQLMQRQRQQQLQQNHQPQQQQQQAQQQQHSPQDASGMPFNIGVHASGAYPNTNPLLGLLGNHGGAGSNNMNAMNLAMGIGGGQQGLMGAGLPRPMSGGVQSSGVGGNVSYEMLQSFMQRNPEGASGMGAG